MKTIFVNTASDVTIHDIRILTESFKEAKRQALLLMRSGDLKQYFNKLLEISRMEEELTQDLAA